MNKNIIAMSLCLVLLSFPCLSEAQAQSVDFGYQSQSAKEVEKNKDNKAEIAEDNKKAARTPKQVDAIVDGITIDNKLKVIDREYLSIYSTIPLQKNNDDAENSILGWDIDGDNVRDDVQKNIILHYFQETNTLLRQSMLQLASKYQQAMKDIQNGTEIDVGADIKDIHRATKCINDVLSYMQATEPHNITTNQIVNQVTSMTFNNQARTNMYAEIYKRTPIDLPEKIYNANINFCEFWIGESISAYDRKIDNEDYMRNE